MPVGGYSVNGNTLTFTTAPGANQAVFVQYVYGNHQQTNDGQGGLVNVSHSDGYEARWMQAVPIAVDWLWSYSDFSSSSAGWRST